ncbi:MAG TPA: ABC transporter substrate-binding protein, partial [Acidimicrobiales bacterium]|nr:ABC transporter substrate-binding protein [Acidimicrobiales bacterium]
APVLPKAFWSATRTSTSAPGGARPVATGPMLLYKVSKTGACFRRDPYWWGNTQLHLQLHFEYLCDEVTPSPGQQLPALLGGKLDWTNSLLGGAANLGGYPGTGYGVTMYYSSQPYMLPAYTQWLKFDARRWPMSSPEFRRAVAYAANPAKVASDDYAGAVEPAGPVGLLPSLSAYLDNKTVARYGFHFSTARAKTLLRQCGYKGQPLHLEVVAGNPELTAAAATISAQLRAAGIVVSVVTAGVVRYQADLASGNYDMALVAGTGPAPTPWQYFEASLGTPQGLAAGIVPEASRLLAAAAGTPINERLRLRAIYGDLEEIFLQQLPVVPLWYSGAWFEASTSHWRGYPSSAPKSDHYTPVMWTGWLGATTTVLALAQLSPSRKR